MGCGASTQRHPVKAAEEEEAKRKAAEEEEAKRKAVSQAEDALRSAAWNGRDAEVQQGIAKGVDATRERFSKRFEVSKGRLDADSTRLQEQLGLQREYLKTLAELKKAVARYERMATSPK